MVALHLSDLLVTHGFASPPPHFVGPILQGGQFAVDIFFVLSGYILIMTYGRKSGFADFFVHRIARIWPLHVFVLFGLALMVLVLKHLGFTFNSQDNQFFNFAELPYYLFLVSVWFGMPAVWNSPAWSLSAELFVYLLFPLLQLSLRYLDQRRLKIAIAVLLVIEAVLLSVFDYPVTGVEALLRACGGFAVGGALALLANRSPTAPWQVNVYALTALAFICVKLPGIAIIPTVLFIQALAIPGRSVSHRVLASGPAVWFGHISYSIYLLHAPLLFVALQVLHHLHRLQTGPGLIVFCGMYVMVLLAAATASFRIIENPARYAIQRAWNSKTAAQKARHV